MSTFDKLKKNRSKSLEQLTDQLNKIGSKTTYTNPDEGKYWKPTRDAAGNGMAIIRFLPAPGEEDMPFVQLWDHGFQGPTGKWYIENSLSTLRVQDPLGEMNQKLWNSGNEEDKKQAQKQKRRLHYISNVYIIKDSAHPENEGMVFLFKYGKKIFDKLNDLMNPSFEDEKPVNPFDLWEGANFRLKIRLFEGYPNYDKSEFDSPGPLFEDDDKMEAIWKQEHSLKEVIDPKHFKSYDELKAKLHQVLGLDEPAAAKKGSTARAEQEVDEQLDMSNISSAGKTKAAPETKTSEPEDADGDEDDLEFFKSLAKG